MRHIDLSLSRIVKNVLKEDIVKRKKKYSFDIDGDINKAIDRKQLVTLYYDDRQGDKDTQIDPNTGKAKWGNPRGIRTVLPFAFYVSRQNGEKTVRGFHWSDRNTKRGPHLWKEFIVDKIKYLRVSPKHFTDEDIPDDANWNGDKHASKLINIVKRGEPRYYEDEFVTPAEREKERINNDEKGYSSDYLYTNQQGPVEQPKTPNAKKGRNLKTMQNLGKPGKVDYKKAYDAFKQSDARNTFRDWDAAEAERRDQQSQQQRPMTPPQNNAGPVNTRQQSQRPSNDDEENWDEWLNNPNNNNL